MRTKLSRRNFLKSLGIGATSAVLPSTFAAAAQGEELATLLDLSKCVGCENCVFACKEANQAKFPEPQKPFPKMYPSRVPVQDWSDKREVSDRLTPYNWLYIQTAYLDYEGESWEIHIPRRCLHCQNPPCANLCPWGAARKQDNGIVRIDDNICLGGSKCNKVCPWHIPQRQTGVGLYLDLLPSVAGNGVMYKCDRCFDRIAEGQTPACIEACPFGVQTIGPRSEIVAQAHQLAESMPGFIYGEHENGGTNTLYVSPVPFERLQEAIQTGAGQPELKRYPDMLSAETNLAQAMLLAPVAGLAAGALHGVRLLHKASKEDNDG
ncbi:MAG: 4Fe-4S dicluster domain-containing protein [Thermodesulfobacteriota bacterium]